MKGVDMDIVGKRVIFTVVPQQLFNGINLLPKTGIQFEKINFPVLPAGLHYELSVNPYSLLAETTYNTVTIKVVFVKYRESDDSYILICTAGVCEYPGLCSHYGETVL